MKNLLAALIPIALAAQSDRGQIALQAAGEFTRGDHAALYRRGAPVLLNAITEGAFAQQMGAVAATLGACRPPASAPPVAGPTYTFRLTCDRQTVGLAISLDESGAMQGIFIVPPPPPQTPGPAPNLEVVTGEFRMPARFTAPASGAGPFACVVLVHGSGPADMDEAVGGYKAFRDLADGLAARGVATLRYDKRTRVYGVKSGVKTLDDETVTDAVSAAALCAKQPKVDARRVFVLGHSLGGYAAPRIGKAAGESVRGLIVFAGTSRKLEEVIDEQVTYLGAPVEQGAALKKMIPESWWKDVAGYDPPKVAAALTQPILVLQGERDYQVTMADFARWRTALGETRRAVFKTYPKLNHHFVAGEGKPGPAEYMKPGHVATEVVDDIAAWVKAIK